MLEKLDPSKTVPALSSNGRDRQTRPDTCQRVVAAERTHLLLGCYRKGQAEDPDVYVTAVATVLSRYSEAIVRKVTDPAAGLPSQSDWLPTIAEVKAACEREMEPQRREAARMLREREARLLLAGPPEADAEARAKAVARWEAQKLEMQHKKSAEQIRTEAEERLRELAKESLNRTPLKIGAELSAKLSAMPKRERTAA